MRKIEEQMVQAVGRGYDWKSGNTEVLWIDKKAHVYLHRNLIATLSKSLDGGPHNFHWTLAGWNTVTTRSRINALAQAFGGAGVTTKRGQAYADLGRNGYRDITSTEWVQA